MNANQLRRKQFKSMASLVLVDRHQVRLHTTQIKKQPLQQTEFPVKYPTVDELQQWLAARVRIVDTPELVEVMRQCLLLESKVNPVAAKCTFRFVEHSFR